MQPIEVRDGLPLPRRHLAIAAISIGVSVLVVDGNIAIVALPQISRALALEAASITQVVTIYQMVLLMGLLPLASWADRVGHRRFYLWGQGIFCVASLFAFSVSALSSLVLLRSVQAIGAGMITAVSMALLREIYPNKRLGFGLGLNNIVLASAGSLSPVIGGMLVSHFPWQVVFAAALPLSLISMLLSATLPTDRPASSARHVDVLAGAWSALTILMLVGAVQTLTQPTYMIAGAVVFGLGVTSAFCLIRYESRQQRPVVPVDILRSRMVGSAALALACAYVAMSALMLALPFVLESRFGFTSDAIGWLLLPFPLATLVFAPIAGWASDRVAPMKVGAAGMCLSSVALLCLACIPDGAGPHGIALRIAACAAGFGLFLPSISRVLIGGVPRSRAAAAGGLLSSCRIFGQTMAATLMGVLFAGGSGFGPTPMYCATLFSGIAACCCVVRATDASDPDLRIGACGEAKQ